MTKFAHLYGRTVRAFLWDKMMTCGWIQGHLHEGPTPDRLIIEAENMCFLCDKEATAIEKMDDGVIILSVTFK